MCLAIPGQIKSIEGREAEVDYVGYPPKKAIIGEMGVMVGDWVMVQMGIIAKVMTAEEAKSVLAAWKEMEEGE